MQTLAITKSNSRISPEILSLTWEQKLELCKAWEQSGLSKKKFCKQKGISVATFHGWCLRAWPQSAEANAKLCQVRLINDKAIKAEPIILEVSFPNAIVARVKATEGQLGFLLRELLDATSIIR